MDSTHDPEPILSGGLKCLKIFFGFNRIVPPSQSLRIKIEYTLLRIVAFPADYAVSTKPNVIDGIGRKEINLVRNIKAPHPTRRQHARHRQRQDAELSSQRFEVTVHVAGSAMGGTGFFARGLLSSNHAESRVSGMTTVL